MLVDNALAFYSPPPPTTTNEADLSEFLNTELFGPSASSSLPPASASTSSASPGSTEHSASTSSRESSPSLLTTPPQQPLQNSFPEIQGDDPYGLGSTTSFLNFLNEDWKMDSSLGFGMGSSGGGSAGSYGSNAAFNPFLPPSEFDLISAITAGASSTASNPVADVTMSSTAAPASNAQMAIDPQLVGSPTESGAHDEHESEEADGESAKKAASPEPVLTITPVKVGGHGKARKGTVQGGGITKKHPTSHTQATSTASVTPTPSTVTPTSAAATKNKENVSTKKSGPSSVISDDKDDDDDLPADWRPPPEVFQKMTSKEKRQLRNKISARNFRVRRKEYINTLEMDIAERDRLLQAIRSELGSTQSENLALRQEITALKKALLEGRHINHSQLASHSSAPVVKGAGEGMDINLNAVNGAALEDFLPPPAPLPERSAADEIIARTAAAASPSSSIPSSAPNPSSSLVTPNTQKDISLSSTQAAFWGGVGGYSHGFGIGGGVTPVHTVLMPEISSAGLRHQQQEELNISKWVRDVLAAQTASEEEEQVQRPQKRRLQENMNPALNESMDVEEEVAQDSSEFEQFVDSNTFTMKSIDAYRMHLWTKMAASHPVNPRPANPNPNPNPTPKASPSSSPTIHAPTPSPPVVHQKYHPDRISSPSPFAPLPSQTPSSPPSHYLTSPHLINPKASLSTRSLASQLRPHYFVSSQKPNLPSGSPTPSYSSLSKVLGTGFLGTGAGAGALGNKPASSTTTTTAEQQQQMMYAATASLASQTLLGKLGGAFWDAFSGSSKRSWDADKVRKVLEGKAVVQVVDVDEQHHQSTPKPATVKMEVPPSPVLGPSLTRRDPAADSCQWLEEKMKGLSLAKKN
ncbi:hypothetical protein V5O48_015482 [Marasmius crinis-equi]|uniref:BZIP domain-containing protein n=1 Tax=Marasmius crinis-equi TaxID=585013 RepID=A0ABR3EUQ6_9AGAR